MGAQRVTNCRVVMTSETTIVMPTQAMQRDMHPGLIVQFAPFGADLPLIFFRFLEILEIGRLADAFSNRLHADCRQLRADVVEHQTARHRTFVAGDQHAERAAKRGAYPIHFDQFRRGQQAADIRDIRPAYTRSPHAANRFRHAPQGRYRTPGGYRRAPRRRHLNHARCASCHAHILRRVDSPLRPSLGIGQAAKGAESIGVTV